MAAERRTMVIRVSLETDPRTLKEEVQLPHVVEVEVIDFEGRPRKLDLTPGSDDVNAERDGLFYILVNHDLWGMGLSFDIF